MKRIFLISPVAIGALIAAAFLLHSRGKVPSPPGPTHPPSVVGSPSNPQGKESGNSEIHRLDLTNSKRTAEILRRRARTNPSFLKELIAVLSDPSSDARLRQIIATVLGTLANAEAQEALLEVLKNARDPALIRTLLLALGAFKPDFESDDLFNVKGPNAVELECGLTIHIRYKLIEDPIRLAILERLEDADAGIRRAASLAIRSSTDFQEVREGLLNITRKETDPEVRMLGAGALADWVGAQSETSPETETVVSTILKAGGEADAAAVRFSTQAGLERTDLSTSNLATIESLLNSPSDLNTTAWAMSLLTSKAGQDPDRDQRALEILVSLSGHSDPKVREHAVRNAGRYSGDVPLGIVERGIRDSAWHVRLAGYRSLETSAPTPRALELAQRGAQDQDGRVIQAAERALRALQARRQNP